MRSALMSNHTDSDALAELFEGPGLSCADAERDVDFAA